MPSARAVSCRKASAQQSSRAKPADSKTMTSSAERRPASSPASTRQNSVTGKSAGICWITPSMRVCGSNSPNTRAASSTPRCTRVHVGEHAEGHHRGQALAAHEAHDVLGAEVKRGGAGRPAPGRRGGLGCDGRSGAVGSERVGRGEHRVLQVAGLGGSGMERIRERVAAKVTRARCCAIGTTLNTSAAQTAEMIKMSSGHGPAHVHVQRVQRVARCHEEPVALGAAEAQVRAALG